VSPSLTLTTDSSILLLSFSNNFGEIFEQYTNISIIAIDGYQNLLTGFTYTQLPTIDDYNLALDFSQAIATKPLLTLDLQLPPQCIFNTSNNLKLTTQVVSITLEDQYALSASTKQMISDAKATTEEMNSASSSAFMANNMIPSGASFAFRCLVSMDTIRFLRFFLIDYPPNVLAMFETKLPTSEILPKVLLDEDERDGSLPDIFTTYEVSIYIFNNCGNEVIQLFAYIAVGVIVILLMNCFFKRLESKPAKILLILLRMIFVWNFCMSNVLSSFMTFSLYTFLAIRFPVSTTLMGKFNLFFSFFMGILICAFLIIVFSTIKKLRPFIVHEVFFFIF